MLFILQTTLSITMISFLQAVAQHTPIALNRMKSAWILEQKPQHVVRRLGH